MSMKIQQEKREILKGPPRKKKVIGNEQLLKTINKRQNERLRIFQKLEESLTATSNRNHSLKTFFVSMAEAVLIFSLALVIKR